MGITSRETSTWDSRRPLPTVALDEGTPVIAEDRYESLPTRREGGVLAVRPARPEDATAMALAHVRAWQSAYPGLIAQQYLDRLDVDERADAWRRRLSEPQKDSRLLVGTVDERVAGFTTFGSARDAESGDDGELHALNVHPRHWRAGVGSALLSAAHAGLAELGCREAVLWVVPGNVRARRFYERHGWVVEKRERTRDVQGETVPEVRYARQVP